MLFIFLKMFNLTKTVLVSFILFLYFKNLLFLGVIYFHLFQVTLSLAPALQHCCLPFSSLIPLVPSLLRAFLHALPFAWDVHPLLLPPAPKMSFFSEKPQVTCSLGMLCFSFIALSTLCYYILYN